MPLKALLFDFNGVILDDEPVHKQLLAELLVSENLKPQVGEFEQYCLGRSDRACLQDLLSSRGRFPGEAQLNRLIAYKAERYRQRLGALEKLPIFAGVAELLSELASRGLKLAVVTGSLKAEVQSVLLQLQWQDYFSVVVAADDITRSKPEPEGYLLAVERLGQTFPDLQLTPANCLAIEDSFAGIEAAKRAGIPVVGVAHTYPFHMLQRRTNWAIDRLADLELDRIVAHFGVANANPVANLVTSPDDPAPDGPSPDESTPVRS